MYSSMSEYFTAEHIVNSCSVLSKGATVLARFNHPTTALLNGNEIVEPADHTERFRVNWFMGGSCDHPEHPYK